jgi:hypothetical protein
MQQALYFLPAYSKVQKNEVIEKDKGRTTKSHIIGGVGYTLGSLVVVGVIVVQSFEFGF